MRRAALALSVLLGGAALAQSDPIVLSCQGAAGGISFQLKLDHDRRTLTHVTSEGEETPLATQEWNPDQVVATAKRSGQRYTFDRRSGRLVTLRTAKDRAIWDCRPSRRLL